MEPSPARLACIYKLIALGLFAVLVVFQLYKVFNTQFWFDDAVFADVAKNLAFGKGYAVLLDDGLARFHHGITTGPVMIVPAALLVMALGNLYWVPSLAAVLVIAGLLAGVLCQLQRVAGPVAWQCAALFMLGVMLLTQHDIGFPGEFMMPWHELLGEVPSALFVVIAVLVVARGRTDVKTLFAGGVLAGLGALCKLQCLIGGGTLGVSLAATYVFAPELRSLQGIKKLFFYGLGLVLPLVLFELVKIVSLGQAEYIKTVLGLVSFVKDYDSMADSAAFMHKLMALGQYLGIFSGTGANAVQALIVILGCAGFFPAVAYFSLPFIRKDRLLALSPLGWAGYVLLWAFSLHLFWFLVINSVVLPRYLVQGMVYGAGAIALLVGYKTSVDARKGQILAAAFALGMLGMRYDAAEFFWTGMVQSPYFTEQQAVFEKLRGIKAEAPETLFFSCGYTFELEYLLPGVENFISCDRMFDAAYAGKKRILVSYTPIKTGYVLYGPANQGHRVEMRQNPAPVQRLCPKDDIYAGMHYFAASCREF